MNTSRSTECGTRPSITWARGTPARTARRQASIFGAMPLASPGSNGSSSAAVSSLITDSRSGQFANSPSTSVSTTSFAAPSAAASAAAALSALML